MLYMAPRRARPLFQNTSVLNPGAKTKNNALRCAGGGLQGGGPQSPRACSPCSPRASSSGAPASCTTGGGPRTRTRGQAPRGPGGSSASPRKAPGIVVASPPPAHAVRTPRDPRAHRPPDRGLELPEVQDLRVVELNVHLRTSIPQSSGALPETMTTPNRNNNQNDNKNKATITTNGVMLAGQFSRMKRGVCGPRSCSSPIRPCTSPTNQRGTREDRWDQESRATRARVPPGGGGTSSSDVPMYSNRTDLPSHGFLKPRLGNKQERHEQTTTANCASKRAFFESTPANLQTPGLMDISVLRGRPTFKPSNLPG